MECFKSYLSNRKQAVKIGLTQSSFQTVVSGVLQGSALGPLLFLIYINDLHLSSPLVKFHLFADDTCIFHSSKNYSKLEQELNSTLKNVATWLKANKLTVHVDKSNLILFNLKRNQKSANINIHLGDDKLEPKDYAKYLSVYIHSKLTWEKHIQITNFKLQKAITIIKVMQNFLLEKQLKQLSFTLMKSYIDYGTLAWGGAAKTYLTKIGRSIQKTIKLVMFEEK